MKLILLRRSNYKNFVCWVTASRPGCIRRHPHNWCGDVYVLHNRTVHLRERDVSIQFSLPSTERWSWVVHLITQGNCWNKVKVKKKSVFNALMKHLILMCLNCTFGNESSPVDFKFCEHYWTDVFTTGRLCCKPGNPGAQGNLSFQEVLQTAVTAVSIYDIYMIHRIIISISSE